MIALLLVHFALAGVAPFAARRIGQRVFLLCALAPVATVAWVASHAETILDGGTITERATWVGALDLSISFRLDGFSLAMIALVSGVGALIFAYARWYFSPRPDLGRFAGVFTAFAGSMLGVVVADNLLVLYVFWELTSITSYLLIGFEDEDDAARSAALQALLVTSAGGLAMLAGFVLVGQAAGTYTISELVVDPPNGTATGIGLLLVLLGAFTKSAQIPFHSWLPGAMAAPTPASAYLHSATMVKAGVYLIARLAPAFATTFAFWRPLVVAVGAATMLVGGYRALRQHDLKLLLAHGTVSQLGFMVVLVGFGRPEITFAGMSLLLAHGLFKAALFMVVGIVDHQAHTRDLRELDGLAARMPATFVVALLAAASMAGLPPLFGFVAKESAFDTVLHDGSVAALVAIVAGSVLTVAYSARFLWGAFARKRTSRDPDAYDVVAPPARFLAPAALVSVLGAVLGLAAAPAGAVAREAARAVAPALERPELALWHGFTPALGLSALAVGAGIVLFVARDRVARLQGRVPTVVCTQRTFDGTVAAVNRGSNRVTAIVQNGSLPVYLAVVLGTALLLAGWPLLARGDLPGDLRSADSAMQAGVAGLVLVAAVGATVARSRFPAVLFLGAVGYGVAVLFVIQGAPDLALTQLLVETLALVVFVFVLRHLPPRFATVRWRVGTMLRVGVAAATGAFVTVFALLAGGAREAPAVSGEMVARSLPEGGGRNVVNVILTDFRALDTLGEITVLAVAALGIASLVLAARDSDAERADEEERDAA